MISCRDLEAGGTIEKVNNRLRAVNLRKEKVNRTEIIRFTCDTF
jgi:hypothetical protein